VSGPPSGTAERGRDREGSRSWLRLLWVIRLELHTLLRTPVVYVIGALFLVVQGTSFASLTAAMSDPRRPAPLGAMLEAQLGGTVLSWSLLLMVLSLLAMRAIAEPKHSGAWESLLTCGVSERCAVFGKWLAAVALLGLLWLPTTSYLVVIAAYQSGGAGWDLGSLASGYLGVWAIAAAMLTWTLAASAATYHALIAGALGYLAVMVLLLVGEVASIAPEFSASYPSWASLAVTLSLRTHASALARGEITATALTWIIGVAGVGLSAAVTLAVRGRRRRAEVRTRALVTALLALAAALAHAVAVRSAAAWDVSARDRNTLADSSLAVLAELDQPAEILIIEPTLGALQPIFASAEPLLERMRRRQPRLSIRTLDPVAVPGGLTELARQAGLAEQDLASSGAVVVRIGMRQRVIDFFAMAELTASDAGPQLQRWSVERAVVAALAELLRSSPVSVCATSGHGEPAFSAGNATAIEPDLSILQRRAFDDGVQITTIANGPIPDRCQVVLVGGPRRPIPAVEVLQLARFVEGGGGLVVALSSRTLDAKGHPSPTGLELLLSAANIELVAAVAVDPSNSLARDGSLRLLDGYDEHEINRGFARVRATVWWTPRVLVVAAPAQSLARAGADSWGETDLQTSPPHRDDRDLAGPAVLAAALDRAVSGRIVVMGSMESLTSAVLAAQSSALDLWMVRALRWAARRPLPTVPIPDRAPDQVRLLMTRQERRNVAVLCAAAIPAAWLALGLLIGAVRRRTRDPRQRRTHPRAPR
jgi:ABC-2 type transport system permease protein